MVFFTVHCACQTQGSIQRKMWPALSPIKRPRGSREQSKQQIPGLPKPSRHAIASCNNLKSFEKTLAGAMPSRPSDDYQGLAWCDRFQVLLSEDNACKAPTLPATAVEKFAAAIFLIFETLTIIAVIGLCVRIRKGTVRLKKLPLRLCAVNCKG